MKLTLTVPRSRPAHLASIPAPEGCHAELLEVKVGGESCIAERDPLQPVYHLMLPAMEAGRKVEADATGVDEAGPAAGIGCVEGRDKLDISLAGSPLMTFHYTLDYPKPVINPILTPGGTNMLREPRAAYAEGEHPWQRGLTLMQGAINGVDCWNEKDRETFGRTEQNTMDVTHGPLSLTVGTENTWYVGEKPLMVDSRSYRLFDTARGAAVLDIALTLKASHGPVTIGGTKEAGFLCIRVNPEMNASDGGQMRNAYGATDETGCWSLPSHWMDYFGAVGEEVAGFAVFDHPANLRYPTTWHVRGYGLFAPNCWMFRPDHALPPGETLTFRWRVVIHTGDTQVADIPNRFLDYVDPPRVTWA